MEKKNFWDDNLANNHYVRNEEYIRRLREVAKRERSYIMGGVDMAYESDMMVTIFKDYDGVIETETKMVRDIYNDLSTLDDGPDIVLLRSGDTHLCPMSVNINF